MKEEKPTLYDKCTSTGPLVSLYLPGSIEYDVPSQWTAHRPEHSIEIECVGGWFGEITVQLIPV